MQHIACCCEGDISCATFAVLMSGMNAHEADHGGFKMFSVDM